MNVPPPHRLSVCSIEDAPTALRLSAHQKADVLYADPPWDDAHMATFANLARRQTGVKVEPLRWEVFMLSLVTIASSYVEGWVFIEMGRQHAERTAELMRQELEDVAIHSTSYGRGRPCRLISAHCRPGVAGGYELPPDARYGGLRQVEGVLASVCRQRSIVLDPCCGNGLTASAAIRLGLTFYGCELNGARARKAAQALTKK